MPATALLAAGERLFLVPPLMSRLAENLVYCGKELVFVRALAEMKKNFESRNRPAY
jgi:hypothetical protein